MHLIKQIGPKRKIKLITTLCTNLCQWEIIQPNSLSRLWSKIIETLNSKNWKKSLRMMNFKPFILIIITIARLTVINSKTLPNCKCTDFVNSSGQGNCQNSNITKSDEKLRCEGTFRVSRCKKRAHYFHDKEISKDKKSMWIA